MIKSVTYVLGHPVYTYSKGTTCKDRFCDPWLSSLYTYSKGTACMDRSCDPGLSNLAKEPPARTDPVTPGFPAYIPTAKELPAPPAGTKPQPLFTDFARFWFKKDLVTKIDLFDDKPEHFLSWETSFLRVMSELSVTPNVEHKWLNRTQNKT